MEPRDNFTELVELLDSVDAAKREALILYLLMVAKEKILGQPLE